MTEAEHKKQLVLQKIEGNRKVLRLEIEAVGHALSPIRDLTHSVTSLFTESGSVLKLVYSLLKVAS